jgi:hypothetical protein
VQPNPKNRYANAAAALEALKPIYVIRVPEVQLSQSSLKFKATRLGERLIQTVTINNSIPDTVLEGRWEVAPHPSDPPHTPETHAWIKVAPAQFASNRVECRITVDTSQLMADKTYERQILLHTNSTTETSSIAVQVQTAAIPIATRKPPYSFLALLSGLGFGLVWFIFQLLPLWNLLPAISIPLIVIVGGAFFEAVSGGVAENIFKHIQPPPMFNFPTGIGGILVFLFFWQIILLAVVVMMGGYVMYNTVLFLIFIGAYIVSRVKYVVAEIKKKGFSQKATITLLILTIGLGSSLGVWLKLGALNLPALAAILGTGLPLAGMLLYPPLQRSRLIAKYRQSEQHLIKP